LAHPVGLYSSYRQFIRTVAQLCETEKVRGSKKASKVVFAALEERERKRNQGWKWKAKKRSRRRTQHVGQEKSKKKEAIRRQ